jgi:ribosomal protein S21
MPGRIVIREGENLQQALGRFSHVVRHASRRQWYKTRPGCYEKPSDRLRRKESVRRRNARRPLLGLSRSYTTVYLTLTGLLSPFEPFPARRQQRQRLRLRTEQPTTIDPPAN